MSVKFIIALALLNMSSVRTGRVLLTLYLIKIGAGPFAVGMLAASFSVIPVFFSWAGGRWSDRFGSRWLLMIGVTGSSAGMLLPYFTPSVTTILVAGVLSGLSMSFCNVSLQNLVGVLSTPDNRARNFSDYTLAGSLSNFIGPLIAGFSIDHFGYSSTCLIVVSLGLAPLSMVVLRGSALPRGTGMARTGGSLWHALSEPGVLWVLAACSVAQTANDLFQFYMPVYAHEAGLSPSAIGIVLAAYSAASFLVRFSLPRLISKANETRVLAYAFILGAFAYTLVPLVHNAATLAATSFLIGLALGCMSPITMMLMYTRSAEGRSGEALGLRLTVDNLSRLVGPMLFGLIASGTGLAAVFWLNALLLGSGTFIARRVTGTQRTGEKEGAG